MSGKGGKASPQNGSEGLTAQKTNSEESFLTGKRSGQLIAADATRFKVVGQRPANKKRNAIGHAFICALIQSGYSRFAVSK